MSDEDQDQTENSDEADEFKNTFNDDSTDMNVSEKLKNMISII